MSRSNPNENGTPNPSTRWFEWNGEHGVVRYYDKEEKKNVEVGSDFTFILLDQLGSVRGWDNEADCAIRANEVKDTRQEVLIVKSVKGGTLAEGIYKDIKDRVAAAGGKFVANCYIAFKNSGDKLAIGSLRFSGAALKAWMDFSKANRSSLYKKAIRINGFEEGKKGRVIFRVPVMTLAEISPATDAAAVALDKELQKFFASYFKRNTVDQVEREPDHVSDEEVVADEESNFVEEDRPELTDDDIPF